MQLKMNDFNAVINSFIKYLKCIIPFAFSGSLRWFKETASSIKVCPLVGLKFMDADRKWNAGKIREHALQKNWNPLFKTYQKQTVVEWGVQGQDCKESSNQTALNSLPFSNTLWQQRIFFFQKSTFQCCSTNEGTLESLQKPSCILPMLHPNHDSLELIWRNISFIQINEIGNQNSFLPTDPAANTALALFGSNAMALPSCSKAAACDPFWRYSNPSDVQISGFSGKVWAPWR